MTDRVDELLQHAGQRWRADQPTPPEPDVSRWSRPARPSRRWVPMVATAGATAVVLGIGYASVSHFAAGAPDSDDHVSVATAPSTPAAAGLVVRDGDAVRASGMVLAAPGQPIRFCAPALTAGVARFGEPEGAPDCQFGVAVTGVDIDRLANAEQREGVRFGKASLRGTWRAGTLQVTQQGPPAPTTTVPPVPDTPCPPPAKGWATTGPVDGKELHQYVEEEHPDRFRRLRVSYPNGWATSAPGATPQAGAVEVMVVEVVRGDVDTARRELRKRYAGNLCVVHRPGAKSLADQTATHDTVQPALSRLMHDPANGIYSSGGADTVIIDLVVLTPALYDKLVELDLDSVEVHPWLRPA